MSAIIKHYAIYRAHKKNIRSWPMKLAVHSNQRGSILIGLIVTMVVMAALGAGMVYLTSTSTFQELMANNHARAHYAAESGGRYANALIRQTLATGTPVNFATLQATYFGTNLNPTTYSLSGGETFQIANWQETTPGGSQQVVYESRGTAGTGFLQAKVKLHYRINPANQQSGTGGSSGPPPAQYALPRSASDFDIPKTALDIYYSPVDMSQVDIKDNPFVDSDRALNLKADYYIMGLKWYANPAEMLQFDKIRTNNAGLLNYRAQVKIKVNNDRADKFNKYNIIGMSFRLDDTIGTVMTTDAAYPDSYGISFVKLPGPKDPNINSTFYKDAPSWFKNVIYPETTWDAVSDGTWYVTLWKRAAGATGSHMVLAYRKLGATDWVCEMVEGYCNLKPWSTLYVDVEERIGTGTADANNFTFTSGVRYNVIKAYLQSNSVGTNGLPPTPPGPYVRSTAALVQDIWWEDNDLTTPPVSFASPIFQPVTWTWVGSGASLDATLKIVADASLTTLNYDSISALTIQNWRGTWTSSVAYTIADGVSNRNGEVYISKLNHTSAASNEPGFGANWTAYWTKITAKPREIGLHIYNISTNAQTVFYDNFYIDLSPSGGGGGGLIDGTGEVVVSP